MASEDSKMEDNHSPGLDSTATTAKSRFSKKWSLNSGHSSDDVQSVQQKQDLGSKVDRASLVASSKTRKSGRSHLNHIMQGIADNICIILAMVLLFCAVAGLYIVVYVTHLKMDKLSGEIADLVSDLHNKTCPAFVHLH